MKEFPQHFLSSSESNEHRQLLKTKSRRFGCYDILSSVTIQCKVDKTLFFFLFLTVSLSVGVHKSVCFCILNHEADVAHAYFAVLQGDSRRASLIRFSVLTASGWSRT